MGDIDDEGYRDVDGEPVHLNVLCRREPDWAANQIRDRDSLRAKVAELERLNLKLEGAAYHYDHVVGPQQQQREQELADRVAELEGAIRDTIVDGCEYGDNCPRGANHYVCRPCQLNRALAGAPQGGGEDG